MQRCTFHAFRLSSVLLAIRFPNTTGAGRGLRGLRGPGNPASIGAVRTALFAAILLSAGPAAAQNAGDPAADRVRGGNDTAWSDDGTRPGDSVAAMAGTDADAYARDSVDRDTLPEVGSIRPEDTRDLKRRREAKKFSAAGFGPAGFGNVDEHVPAYDVYLGRFWEVNRYAAIKALGEVATDFDRATLANLTLGANLYSTPTDFAPYLGAGLGVGYGARSGDRDFGFNLGAQIGALLFRTSNAQMNLEGSAAMIVSEVGDGAPTIYAARLGVLF